MQFKKFYLMLLENVEAMQEKKINYLYEKYKNKLGRGLEKYIDHIRGPRSFGQRNKYMLPLFVTIIEKIIKEIDPSKVGKYSEWILQNINEFMSLREVKRFFEEDSYKVKRDLETFHKFKHKFTEKDINKYTFKTLWEAAEDLREKEGDSSKREEAEKGAPVLFENDKWIIRNLKTYQSAVYFGGGTNWCVSYSDSDEYFNSYVKRGILYFLYDKKKNSKEGKYLFHFETHQFMDYEDSPIPVVYEYGYESPFNDEDILNFFEKERVKDLNSYDYLEEMFRHIIDVSDCINYVNDNGREDKNSLEIKAGHVMSSSTINIIKSKMWENDEGADRIPELAIYKFWNIVVDEYNKNTKTDVQIKNVYTVSQSFPRFFKKESLLSISKLLIVVEFDKFLEKMRVFMLFVKDFIKNVNYTIGWFYKQSHDDMNKVLLKMYDEYMARDNYKNNYKKLL